MPSVAALPPVFAFTLDALPSWSRPVSINYPGTYALEEPLPVFGAAQDVGVTSSSDLVRSIDELEALHRQLLEKKRSVAERYTHEAEMAVDMFLVKEYHFVADAVPWDYLEEAPRRMSDVEANLDTLLHVTAEVFLAQSRISVAVIRPFVNHVWTDHLRPLVIELSDALRTSRAVHHAVTNLGQRVMESGPRQRVMAICEGIDRDLHHLYAMESLDRDFLGKEMRQTVGTSIEDHVGDFLHAHEAVHGKGLCETVPISGILVGRLHRLENEHRTVVEHWSQRKMTNK